MNVLAWDSLEGKSAEFRGCEIEDVNSKTIKGQIRVNNAQSFDRVRRLAEIS